MDNPHMAIARIAEGENDWECLYCGDRGTMDELSTRECTHIYPPCPHCGQTLECAIDCSGMANLLQGFIDNDEVYISGIDPTEDDTIQ